MSKYRMLYGTDGYYYVQKQYKNIFGKKKWKTLDRYGVPESILYFTFAERYIDIKEAKNAVKRFKQGNRIIS